MAEAAGAPAAAATPVYVIRNQHSGKLLNVEGGGLENGTNVQLWGDNHNSRHNHWLLVPVLTADGDSIYGIQSLHNDKYLEAQQQGKHDGTNVQLWAGNGPSKRHRQWRILPSPVTGEAVVIQNQHSGKLLNVTGGGLADGTNVHLWGGDESLSHNQWRIIEKFRIPSARRAAPPFRGVNLGGWLVVEKWMNQALFDVLPGATVRDEFSLARGLGARASDVFTKHRNEWITEADFRAIRAAGLDSVRLPLGFWVLDCGAAEVNRGPWVGPCERVLWQALGWAQDHRLRVNLCLHGCPGGQSGHHATGREQKDWDPSMWNFPATLECLRRLATIFGGHPSVAAITVTNEPSCHIPAAVLSTFYTCACKVIRECTPRRPDIVIILPVYHRHWGDFHPFFEMISCVDANVAVDLHLYQCFGDVWQSRDLEDHLSRARSGQGHSPGVVDIVSSSRIPVIVGEWSLRLPTWGTSWPCRRVNAMAPEDQGQVYRQFAEAQLHQFSTLTLGHFFWNWKVDAGRANGGEGEPFWDLQACLERHFIVLPKIVHVIRHGEAAHNIDKHCERQRNTALTEAGRQQAHSLQSIAMSPPPEVVLTSPILRALQTTNALFDDHFRQLFPASLTIHVVPDARERISKPEHLCELPLPSPAAAPQGSGDFSTYDWSLVMTAHGGNVEAWEQLLQTTDADKANIDLRAKRLSDYIESRSETTFCLVSHGAFLMRLTGDDYMRNCEMRTYELKGGVWMRR